MSANENGNSEVLDLGMQCQREVFCTQPFDPAIRLMIMRYLALFFSLALLFSSCHKDTEPSKIKYTSDEPDTYGMIILVKYDQSANATSVQAYFNDQTGQLLKLSENSSVKYNGDELTGDYVLGLTFQGKENALIEYLDFNQTRYSNTIIAPDTVFVQNLSDTVNADQDLLLNFSGPALGEDEYWEVYISAYNTDNGEYYDTTTDSSMLIDKMNLFKYDSHLLSVQRVKTLIDPGLPAGGGRIQYRYQVTRTIFAE